MRRLLDDTRSFCDDYHARARVTQLSDKAFGYDVAVKEYLKKVKKLLPEWILTFEGSGDGGAPSPAKSPARSPSHRAASPRAAPSRPAMASPKAAAAQGPILVSRSPVQSTERVVVARPSPSRRQEAAVSPVPAPASRQSPEPKKSAVKKSPVAPAASPPPRAPAPAPAAAAAPFPGDLRSPARAEEESDSYYSDEEEEGGLRSPASLSPAYVPVQTSSFTTIAAAKADTPARIRTPETSAASFERASPWGDTSQPDFPSPPPPIVRSAERPAQPTPQAQAEAEGFGAQDEREEEPTPTRVRFLGEEVDLEEDSQDTFGSYIDQSEPASVSPPAQQFSSSRVHATDSERSLGGFVERENATSESASASGTPARSRTPVASAAAGRARNSPSASEPRVASPAAPASASREGSAKRAAAATPPAQKSERRAEPEPQRAPPLASEPKAEVKKVSTIINRTFDTDTEDSEVYYQSYQTKELAEDESSDEFDF